MRKWCGVLHARQTVLCFCWYQFLPAIESRAQLTYVEQRHNDSLTQSFSLGPKYSVTEEITRPVANFSEHHRDAKTERKLSSYQWEYRDRCQRCRWQGRSCPSCSTAGRGRARFHFHQRQIRMHTVPMRSEGQPCTEGGQVQKYSPELQKNKMHRKIKTDSFTTSSDPQDCLSNIFDSWLKVSPK